MSIVIAIRPDVEAELTRQAAAHGLQREDYAAALLEEAIHRLDASAKRLTLDQLDRTLREVAQYSHKVPLLPDKAFTREDLYENHN